ncbi:MAG: polynucleotide kinase-phosphatase [Acidimicrobiales bacterium]|nr:polynucleotide kinase-phosphatase [Acidimicrobiales bacterium]
MNIKFPELSLVVLIGASSSGKSTFARKHFKSSEVISSDSCRSMLADDENALDVNKEAFELLGNIATARLSLRRIAVIDATSVQIDARKSLINLARENDVLAAAIVFDLPDAVILDRSRKRSDRELEANVIRNQSHQLRQSIRNLQREGFRYVYVLKTQEEVDAVVIERQRLWTDRRDDHGPFDIIGDIHGCNDELTEILLELGYLFLDGAFRHPDGRQAIFLGDLVDRGPDTPAVLRTVMSMVKAGTGLAVPGNHDIKLIKALQGRKVKISHGLAESLKQLESESSEFHQEIIRFIDGLVSHLVLDDGHLVVAHAGLNEKLQGRASGRVRNFALFGETTGETDEFGLPVRYNWASDYRGKAIVTYGHTPILEAEWVNNTICLDTGCVFGGHLTAMRYPEKELVSVKAKRTYYESQKPLGIDKPQAANGDDLLLDIADVIGRRPVHTRLLGNITISESHSAAALEAMSRFAVDPRWLVYLPPTMSPPTTSSVEGLLEHPIQAFDAFRNIGITSLICEEKHMGSRSVAIIGRDAAAVEKRFQIKNEAGGIIYTRTGRKFFSDQAIESAVLKRLRTAISSAGLWEELSTEWMVIDMELMPWSAKAAELLLNQYAAVRSAAYQAFKEANLNLSAAMARGIDVGELKERTQARSDLIEGYQNAYRHYCWDVGSVDDLRVAPFHLLASEGKVHVDRDHSWHMGTLARLVSESDPLIVTTANISVSLDDPESEARAVLWWEELTATGGEGMVVKPLEFLVKSKRGIAQPAIKCRGPEYLRIIYGPEYTLPNNLMRLRRRSVGLKRSLALREFALGIEALERFVDKQGLHRVHECVFGVLALESEPVDPRL